MAFYPKILMMSALRLSASQEQIQIAARCAAKATLDI